MLDRERALEQFKIYTAKYDSSNEQISLKILHTLHVAENCEKIAISIGLSKLDTNLAWLIGLLHDYGRFEQVRRYHTFNDRASVDHAELGADLLFEKNEIWNYVPPEFPPEVLRIAETAIRQHNKYRISDNLSERTATFCNIVRDADKVDIFRIVRTSSYDAVYEKSAKDILKSPISDAVMDTFRSRTCIERSVRKHPADWVVGHISLAFELVYPESVRLTQEQGNLSSIMNFPTENPETGARFAEIRSFMNDYIQSRLE